MVTHIVREKIQNVCGSWPNDGINYTVKRPDIIFKDKHLADTLRSWIFRLNAQVLVSFLSPYIVYIHLYLYIKIL